MSQPRLLLALASIVLSTAASAQQTAPQAPVSRIQMKGQENLKAEEREALNKKLAELSAKRKAEREADLADMHAKRSASDFALLKGEFRTHENGMLVRDALVGTGTEALHGDTIETHYTTYYLDGRKFESSRDRDKLFPVVNLGKSAMIEAWDSGLLGIREGGTRLIVAQSAVAYGKFDSVNGVPGGTHLVFEIEAVKVISAPRRPDVAALKLTQNASGLRWADVVVGEGDVIDAGDTAMIHYSGWLHDRKDEQAFDSSFQVGQPYPVANIGRAAVLPGWNEGLLGMRAGGRRVLLLPPELAYGKEGSGDDIPPDATLLFLLEAWSVFPVRPDVATLTLTTNASGLQWGELIEGEGRQAQAGDEVRVHFTGWLDNGQIFDSTWFSKLAVTIPNLGEAPVIAGLNEGLIGMRAGEKRVLVIPASLAYGSEGAAKAVPPDSRLTLLVDMLEARAPNPLLQESN